jgi:hypothetical protein
MKTNDGSWDGLLWVKSADVKNPFQEGGPLVVDPWSTDGGTSAILITPIVVTQACSAPISGQDPIV